MRAQKDDDGDEKSFQNYSLKYLFKIRQIAKIFYEKAKIFFENAKNESSEG